MASFESECVLGTPLSAPFPLCRFGEGVRGRGNVFPKNDNRCGQQGEYLLFCEETRERFSGEKVFLRGQGELFMEEEAVVFR